MAGRERVSPAEIAALTARLRALSVAGSDVDEAERELFLRDKEQLLTRIENDTAAPVDPRAEWDSVRGDDPRSYDQLMSDSAGVLVAGLGLHGSHEGSAGRDDVDRPYWVDADRDDDGDADAWGAS